MPILRYALDRTEKGAFDALCIALLRNTISPLVRQVSVSGRDGGRDALLHGKCVTGRFQDASIKKWIFQFKQYQLNLRAARSEAVRAFEREGDAALTRYQACQAYFFLTSVPFSGVPETGMFDRVQEISRKLSKKHEALVVFWDGIELCNHR